MRLLLTGASGLLGGNVAAVAARQGHVVTGLVGRWGGPEIAGLRRQVSVDLADPLAVDAVVRAERPEAIIHCAALSEPARCEEVPDAAERLNVTLPVQLAALAVELGARLIHVSSEQVFDGRHPPYRADDPVAPLGLYARQKADSERLVLGVAPRLAACVRVPLLMGNSPGGRRSVHERLLLDWAAGRVARLFTDEIRQVAMADNSAAALVELAERGDLCGVLHWAGTEPVSRHALGLAIAGRFRIPAEGRIVAAQLAGTPLAATRPADLSLDLRPLSAELRTRPEALGPQLERLVPPPAVRDWIRHYA